MTSKGYSETNLGSLGENWQVWIFVWMDWFQTRCIRYMLVALRCQLPVWVGGIWNLTFVFTLHFTFKYCIAAHNVLKYSAYCWLNIKVEKLTFILYSPASVLIMISDIFVQGTWDEDITCFMAFLGRWKWKLYFGYYFFSFQIIFKYLGTCYTEVLRNWKIRICFREMRNLYLCKKLC